MILWKYNRAVGRWERQRECSADEAAQWLNVFQRDAPGEHFILAEKAPSRAPDGRQLPRLVKGRYVICK